MIRADLIAISSPNDELVRVKKDLIEPFVSLKPHEISWLVRWVKRAFESSFVRRAFLINQQVRGFLRVSESLSGE